jgi:uroporphyrin-3 C-methyltransferase
MEDNGPNTPSPPEKSDERADEPTASSMAEETEPDSKASTAAATPRRSWSGVLALFVAVLAAAAVGYLWLKPPGQDEFRDQLGIIRADLDARTREMQSLVGDVESLLEAERRGADDLAVVADRLERQARQLEELPLRMGRLERALENVPGVADRARTAWLLAEAEYYLRVANAQLSLAGNVDVAMRGLELADEKLRDLGDPGLTRVRSLLADEITALRAVPRPDAEGIVLKLGALARSVDTLPLVREVPPRFGGTRKVDQELTGFARAWQAVLDALRSVISVKRSDATVTPLRSPEAESMLVRSLDLELQIARLAIIRSDAAAYRQSMNAAATRLQRYFDTESTEVQSAMQSIEELAAAELPEQMPNISGSLSLLLSLGGGDAVP